MIKLITIDVDGTLVTPLKRLTQKNIKEIDRARDLGVHIALASGRPFHSMEKYIRRLGLMKEGHFSVCQNGSYIVDNETKKPIAGSFQSVSDLVRLDELMAGFDVEVSAMDDVGFYTRHKNPSIYTQMDAVINSLTLTPVNYEDFPEDMRFGRFLILGSKASIKKVLANMPKEVSENYYAVQTAPFLIEVMNKTANKGHAVRQMAARLGISADEIMSIGNEKNDIPMLEQTGFPVAMANSVPELKAHAKFITKSNRQSGVGYAIERLIDNGLEIFE